MSRETAKGFFTKGGGEPDTRWLSPQDARDAVDTMYDDLEVVGTARLSDDAVTAAKIAAGAVGSSEIADGAIMNGDINAAAAIARSKIAGLPLSSTDNTLPRFDGTGGALQTSGVVVDDNNRLTVASGSTGGLEIGSSGILRLAGSGDPSGVSAPIGSEYVQTNANATYGNLVGIRWLKVGSGTTVGTDWLPDFGGRWITYTPTCNWTNVTVTGRYTMTGKLCTVRARVVVSGTTVYAGSCTLSLPQTPVSNSEVRAASAIGRVASTYYQFVALPSSDLGIYPMGASGAWGTFSSTVPATWANGNFVDATFTYEIG